MRAKETITYAHDMERLLDELEGVRRVTVIRPSGHKGRPRVNTQLEEGSPELKTFLRSLGVEA
jgi:hypothetical protein